MLGWLIILFPLLSFVLLAIPVRWWINNKKIQYYTAITISISAVALSFIFACIQLSQTISQGTQEIFLFDWIVFGSDAITFSLVLDPLSTIMFFTVSLVSFLIQVYSVGYLGRDKSFTRYFAFMSLFTASMLALVSSNNLIQLFISWELVGICSYLLIGFWSTRKAAPVAAKKAFLMTRFGDFFFLVAILYIFALDSSYLNISELFGALESGSISPALMIFPAIGFLIGAIGKSAQFPLHTWLSDAMEGPTSVSALIHSATMVTAGVVLIARLFPIYEYSDVLIVVQIVGAFTAIFSATMALVSKDIKKVLAFSTVSQIGYMFFALGIGAYAAAIFHLFTHAFFKSGLFLVAGSVHHNTGTFNMKYHGGLWKRMRITSIVAIICAISLAAVFPFAGFWSKDEILAHALDHGNYTGFVVLLVTSLITTLYAFRLIFMTFFGKYRGGADEEIRKCKTEGIEIPEQLGQAGNHESPKIMLTPMIVIAFIGIVAGFVVNPPWIDFIFPTHAFAHFLTSSELIFPTSQAVVKAGGEPEFNSLTAILSTLFALSGIVLAYLHYRQKLKHFTKNQIIKQVSGVFYNRYYLDSLYEKYIVEKVVLKQLADKMNLFDNKFIDQINLSVSKLTLLAGRLVNVGQNGQLQFYIIGMLIGLVLLGIVLISI